MAPDFATLHAPIGRHFRRRRLGRLARTFDIDDSTTILDVGGDEYYWRWLPARPRVTVVNLEGRDLRRAAMDWVHADGCRLPFADRAFDVVFCNSVLEHVLDDVRRASLAHEIARVGRGYCVQTPNRWFPVEAHTLTPGFQFLPKGWQARLARNFTVWGWLQRPDKAEAWGFVGNTRLLAPRDLARLFPGASIERERFLGMTKSVSAVCKQRR